MKVISEVLTTMAVTAAITAALGGLYIVRAEAEGLLPGVQVSTERVGPVAPAPAGPTEDDPAFDCRATTERGDKER